MDEPTTPIPPGDPRRSIAGRDAGFCGVDDQPRAFRGSPCRWLRDVVTYRLEVPSLGLFSGDQFAALFARAVGYWTAVANFECRPAVGGEKVDFRVFPHAMDGKFRVLGDSEIPCGADYARPLQQRYDSTDEWSESMLLRVMIHECGHMWGISHLSDPKAAMYPSLRDFTGLAAPDVEAIQQRYGRRTQPAPVPPPTPTPGPTPTPPPPPSPVGLPDIFVDRYYFRSLYGRRPFRLVRVGWEGMRGSKPGPRGPHNESFIRDERGVAWPYIFVDESTLP